MSVLTTWSSLKILCHDFERTPFAGTTRPVLFAGERGLTSSKYAMRNPGYVTIILRALVHIGGGVRPSIQSVSPIDTMSFTCKSQPTSMVVPAKNENKGECM